MFGYPYSGFAVYYFLLFDYWVNFDTFMNSVKLVTEKKNALL